MNEQDPKIKKIVTAADGLSLGISIVVAVLIGIAIGLGLKRVTEVGWTLWIGVFIGIGAALRNIQIAYTKQKASLDELARDPRYQKRRFYDEDDED